jgi:hypothetical protein
MKNIFGLLCLVILANPVFAGEWLDCKRQQARNQNEKIDCKKYEKPQPDPKKPDAPPSTKEESKNIR